MPSTSAGALVAMRTASAGDTPASTISSSSRCSMKPGTWSCTPVSAPRTSRAPASASFFRLRCIAAYDSPARAAASGVRASNEARMRASTSSATDSSSSGSATQAGGSTCRPRSEMLRFGMTNTSFSTTAATSASSISASRGRWANPSTPAATSARASSR